MPNTVRNAGLERDPLWTAFFIIFTMLAVLLFVNDPLCCQRYWTATLGIKAVFIAHGLWRSPQGLQRLGGLNDEPKWFIKTWARWKLVALLTLILANESAIIYGTLTEWVIMWAMAPVTVYCLMFWSIKASWEDDAD